MLATRNIMRLCCAFVLLFSSLCCHADTLQLVSTSGGSTGGVNVSPYNFSVNGSDTLTELACLNFNREITFGEKWQVNVHGLDMGLSNTAVKYRADALLFWGFGKFGLSNSDLQFAIWSIFDSNAKLNSGYTEMSDKLVSIAMDYAMNQDLINSGFFQNFSLYTPTSDQTGWTAGVPQEFIGTAVTPEPSGVALLGTGLLCTGLFWYRKRFTAVGQLAC